MHFEGRPLAHTPGDTLLKRGVEVGDFIYVVTMRQGRLFLVGKMQVGQIITSNEAVEVCLGYQPWPAVNHLLAKFCTPMHFYRPVAVNLTQRLKFRTARGLTSFKFRPNDQLDPQTLRPPRELTPTSAIELDKLLERMSEMEGCE